MSSIQDYYQGNVVSNIGEFRDWDSFVHCYGLMVSGSYWNELKSHTEYGEYFQSMNRSLRVYPAYNHSVYTLNVFRHFMELGEDHSKMLEDMVCELVKNGECFTVDKYINEILDIADYIDFKEMNMDLTEALEACSWWAVEDEYQSANYNAFLRIAKDQGSDIANLNSLDFIEI